MFQPAPKTKAQKGVGKPAPKVSAIKPSGKVAAPKKKANVAQPKSPAKKKESSQNNAHVKKNTKDNNQGGPRKRPRHEEKKSLDDGQPWFGTVDMWNAEKGFGFIISDDSVDANVIPEAKMNNGKIFISRDDIAGVFMKDLSPGARVTFSLYMDSRGLGASNLQAVGFNGQPVAANNQMPASLAGIQASSLRNIKAGDVIVRVRIPNDFIGGLIGKGGEVVKQLRKQTGAEFNFEEFNPADGIIDDPDVLNLADPHARRKPGCAMVEVSGSHDNVISGLKEIAERMQMGALSLFQRMVFVCPDKLVGKIIGKKGENIKKLRGESPSFRVHVNPSAREIVAANGAHEQVCLITIFGPSSDVANAITKLVGTLHSEFDRDMDMIKSREQSMSMSMDMMGRGGFGFNNGFGGGNFNQQMGGMHGFSNGFGRGAGGGSGHGWGKGRRF